MGCSLVVYFFVPSFCLFFFYFVPSVATALISRAHGLTNPVPYAHRSSLYLPPWPPQALVDLVSYKQNFRNMRQAIARSSSPVTPYLGMYLSDITFLEQGNPDETPDGLINVAKMSLFARSLETLTSMRTGKYRLVGVPAIRVRFSAVPSPVAMVVV